MEASVKRLPFMRRDTIQTAKSRPRSSKMSENLVFNKGKF